jgi:hypothetical protein
MTGEKPMRIFFISIRSPRKEEKNKEQNYPLKDWVK